MEPSLHVVHPRSQRTDAPQRDDAEAAETALVEGFLRDVDAAVTLPVDLSAADAATAVIGALTVRLEPELASQFHDALPPPLRRLFRSSEREPQEPGEPPGREAFLARTAERLVLDLAEAEPIAFGVLSALRARLDDGTVDVLADKLPDALGRLLHEAVPGMSPLSRHLQQFVIERIERSGALPLGMPAAQAFAGVMCALARALGEPKATPVVRGLAGNLRPWFERCALHRAQPPSGVEAPPFLGWVGEHVQAAPDRAERAARLVFAAIQRFALSPQEVAAVADALRGSLQELWREPQPLGEPRFSFDR